MHVAYLVAKFPEPSESFLRREITALAQQGFRITVWALGRSDVSGCFVRPVSRRIDVVYRPRFGSREGIAALFGLCVRDPVGLILLLTYLCILSGRSPRWAWRLLCNLHAVARFAEHARNGNVQHIHGYFLNLPGVLAMGVAVVARIPFSLAGHAHDVFVDPGPVVVLSRYAQRIVLCTRSAARELADAATHHGEATKLRVIRHGIDIDQWTPASDARPSPPQDVPIVLGIGRLVEKKGFDVLIRACRMLRDRSVACRLMLVGEGPLKGFLRRLVLEERLTEYVTFPGWKQEDGVRRTLYDATVLVVPSIIACDGDRDGIPNVALEAAACGVTVVGSKLPGLSEFITDRVNGLLVEPGNVFGLADTLERVLRDDIVRGNLGRAGRRVVERDFDIRRNVQQVAALFRDTRYADAH